MDHVISLSWHYVWAEEPGLGLYCSMFSMVKLVRIVKDNINLHKSYYVLENHGLYDVWILIELQLFSTLDIYSRGREKNILGKERESRIRCPTKELVQEWWTRSSPCMCSFMIYDLDHIVIPKPGRIILIS